MLYPLNRFNSPIGTVSVHKSFPSGVPQLIRRTYGNRWKGYFLNSRFRIFNKYHQWNINPNRN